MDYDIHIMNCSIVADGNFYHTWLEVQVPGETEPDVFSFHPKGIWCAFTNKCCVNNEGLKAMRRSATEAMKGKITAEAFGRMVQRSKEILQSGRYALIPKQPGEYNCTTATHEVLIAGEIYFLHDVKTPKGLGAKVRKDSEYKQVDSNTCIKGEVLPPLFMALGLACIVGGGFGIYLLCTRKEKNNKK